ncbi:MAG: SLC13 family permease [Burkholderiaceae bacterium]
MKHFFDNLRRDVVFLILAAVCLAWAIASPSRVPDYPKLVDWPTILALTGLLILTKGVEASGALSVVARRLILAIHTERKLALFLVSASALLSTFLTNDVALFVLVPLTLRLRGPSPPQGSVPRDEIPVLRLIGFEAIAVNAGSALTPLGNPQNLFLWGQSGVKFVSFMGTMLPVVAIAMIALLLLTMWAFSSRKLDVDDSQVPAVDRRLLIVSLLLYAPFLVLIDTHHPAIACVAVLAIFALVARRVLVGVDWALLAVFVLMFIDLRLAAQTDVVRHAIEAIGVHEPMRLYATAVLSSQLISNVPAAILLTEYSKDWATIAYGVTVGGFGIFIGSLANLIAMRLAKDSRAWLVFHAYSVPFVFVVGLVTWAWLAWR